jgi:hypothetical protein
MYIRGFSFTARHPLTLHFPTISAIISVAWNDIVGNCTHILNILTGDISEDRNMKICFEMYSTSSYYNRTAVYPSNLVIKIL